MDEKRVIKIISEADEYVKFVSTRTLGEVLNSRLKGKVKNLSGARFNISKNKLSVEFMFIPDKEDASLSNIAKLGYETKEKYTLSKEILENIKEYINPNAPIQTGHVKINDGRQKRDAIRVYLNPNKTINELLEKAPEGLEYIVERIIRNGNDSIIKFKAVKKNVYRNRRNNKNKRYNNNKR